MFLRKFVYRTQKSSGIPSLSENCIQGGGQFKNSVQRGTGYSMSKIPNHKESGYDLLWQFITKCDKS